MFTRLRLIFEASSYSSSSSSIVVARAPRLIIHVYGFLTNIGCRLTYWSLFLWKVFFFAESIKKMRISAKVPILNVRVVVVFPARRAGFYNCTCTKKVFRKYRNSKRKNINHKQNLRDPTRPVHPGTCLPWYRFRRIFLWHFWGYYHPRSFNFNV